MRPVILYVTASLDGFIAEPGGGMAWLDEANTAETDFGYADFYASIQTMLMGSHTYEFVLGVEPFPHGDREVFVFTSRELLVAAPSVTLVRDDAAAFTTSLKTGDGGPIWLVGGGALNRTLWDAGLVDEVRLFVQPVVLGDGIALLQAPHSGGHLLLHASRDWPGGVVELHYHVVNEGRSLP